MVQQKNRTNNRSTKAKKPGHFFQNFNQSKHKRLIGYALVFALVGVAALLSSSADTPIPAYKVPDGRQGILMQVEDMKLNGPAAVYDDYRAMGGKGVKMGNAGFTSTSYSKSDYEALSKGCNLETTSKQLPQISFQLTVNSNALRDTIDFYLRFKETNNLKAYDTSMDRYKSKGDKFYVRIDNKPCASMANFVAFTNTNMPTQNWENNQERPYTYFDVPGANPPETYKIPLTIPSGTHTISIYTSGANEVELDSLMMMDGQLGPGQPGYNAIYNDSQKPLGSPSTSTTAPAPTPTQQATNTTSSKPSEIDYSAEYNDTNTRVIDGVRFVVRSDGSIGNPVALTNEEYKAALAYIEKLKAMGYGLPGRPALPAIGVSKISVMGGEQVDKLKLTEQNVEFEENIQEAIKEHKKTRKNVVRRAVDSISSFFKSLFD